MTEKTDYVPYSVDMFTDIKDNHIAEIELWNEPKNGISFKYDDIEVLNLRPGFATINGETVEDVNKVYGGLSAWVKKVQNYGREDDK